ncbi:hypothetical protein Dda3937_00310 [Dickeya dadantii 3937]|uniref:Uncharacterized protein n=1 Tax=Dickeya dadantii (strain 3937) TaxID=198628 RepID=E0SKL5_DICD3|nr:hypothetical protein Dda3937_00310 [Dickeya dadantii 3937]
MSVRNRHSRGKIFKVRSFAWFIRQKLHQALRSAIPPGECHQQIYRPEPMSYSGADAINEEKALIREDWFPVRLSETSE